jgi:hypothetical protein
LLPHCEYFALDADFSLVERKSGIPAWKLQEGHESDQLHPTEQPLIQVSDGQPFFKSEILTFPKISKIESHCSMGSTPALYLEDFGFDFPHRCQVP